MRKDLDQESPKVTVPSGYGSLSESGSGKLAFSRGFFTTAISKVYTYVCSFLYNAGGLMPLSSGTETAISITFYGF
jgi:hypothetical protein